MNKFKLLSNLLKLSSSTCINLKQLRCINTNFNNILYSSSDNYVSKNVPNNQIKNQ